MAWFEEVFGFAEGGFAQTRRRLAAEKGADGQVVALVSRANGRRFTVGPFEAPSLTELRGRLASAPEPPGSLTFANIVGDVRKLHRDPGNAGAVFQVASQFNCLEMLGPDVKPEDGIAIYENDKTQGPACALCCPAATAFRNYFVGGKGQAGRHQLDMLRDVAEVLGNRKHKYWEMKNGYCLPTNTWGMLELGKRLAAEEGLSAAVKGKLRVGVHWSTQVEGCDHQVCQIFCSALPVAYARGIPRSHWAPFACDILEAAYDATLAAAASLARSRGARVAVYLTALGGGSFGNDPRWIADALGRALLGYSSEALDVKLVHYLSIPPGPFEDFEPAVRAALGKRRSAALAPGAPGANGCAGGACKRRRLGRKTRAPYGFNGTSTGPSMFSI